MRALIQRVKSAKVEVESHIVGSIQQGLLVFLGITHSDSETQVKWLADKLLNLRIFTDELGKMNLSVQDIDGELLIVSQFTLYASCLKGRRPDFIQAASPEKANQLYMQFNQTISERYKPIQTGIFGAKMDVSLLNDGPVTLMIETP